MIPVYHQVVSLNGQSPKISPLKHVICYDIQIRHAIIQYRSLIDMLEVFVSRLDPWKDSHAVHLIVSDAGSLHVISQRVIRIPDDQTVRALLLFLQYHRLLCLCRKYGPERHHDTYSGSNNSFC